MLQVSPGIAPTTAEGTMNDELAFCGSNTLQVIAVQRDIEQQVVGATINPAQFQTSKNVFTGNTSIRKTQEASLTYEHETTTHIQIKAEDLATKNTVMLKVSLSGRSSSVLSPGDVLKLYSLVGGISGTIKNPTITNPKWTPYKLVEVEGQQVICNHSVSFLPGWDAKTFTWLGGIGGFIGGSILLSWAGTMGCFLALAAGGAGAFFARKYKLDEISQTINKFKENELRAHLLKAKQSFG